MAVINPQILPQVTGLRNLPNSFTNVAPNLDFSPLDRAHQINLQRHNLELNKQAQELQREQFEQMQSYREKMLEHESQKLDLERFRTVNTVTDDIYGDFLAVDQDYVQDKLQEYGVIDALSGNINAGNIMATTSRFFSDPGVRERKAKATAFNKKISDAEILSDQLGANKVYFVNDLHKVISDPNMTAKDVYDVDPSQYVEFDISKYIEPIVSHSALKEDEQVDRIETAIYASHPFKVQLERMGLLKPNPNAPPGTARYEGNDIRAAAKILKDIYSKGSFETQMRLAYNKGILTTNGKSTGSRTTMSGGSKDIDVAAYEEGVKRVNNWFKDPNGNDWNVDGLQQLRNTLIPVYTRTSTAKEDNLNSRSKIAQAVLTNGIQLNDDWKAEVLKNANLELAIGRIEGDGETVTMDGEYNMGEDGAPIVTIEDFQENGTIEFKSDTGEYVAKLTTSPLEGEVWHWTLPLGNGYNIATKDNSLDARTKRYSDTLKHLYENEKSFLDEDGNIDVDGKLSSTIKSLKEHYESSRGPEDGEFDLEEEMLKAVYPGGVSQMAVEYYNKGNTSPKLKRALEKSGIKESELKSIANTYSGVESSFKVADKYTNPEEFPEGGSRFLAEVIFAGESTSYDDTFAFGKWMNEGNKNVKLTDKTIKEIYELQKEQRNNTRSYTDEYGIFHPSPLSETHGATYPGTSAMGRGMFIESTLRGIVDTYGPRLGINEDTKYTPEVQRKLTYALLHSLGIDKYYSGEISRDRAIGALKGTWEYLDKSFTDEQVGLLLDEAGRRGIAQEMEGMFNSSSSVSAPSGTQATQPVTRDFTQMDLSQIDPSTFMNIPDTTNTTSTQNTTTTEPVSTTTEEDPLEGVGMYNNEDFLQSINSNEYLRSEALKNINSTNVLKYDPATNSYIKTEGSPLTPGEKRNAVFEYLGKELVVPVTRDGETLYFKTNISTDNLKKSAGGIVDTEIEGIKIEGDRSASGGIENARGKYQLPSGISWSPFTYSISGTIDKGGLQGKGSYYIPAPRKYEKEIKGTWIDSKLDKTKPFTIRNKSYDSLPDFVSKNLLSDKLYVTQLLQEDHPIFYKDSNGRLIQHAEGFKLSAPTVNYASLKAGIPTPTVKDSSIENIGGYYYVKAGENYTRIGKEEEIEDIVISRFNMNDLFNNSSLKKDLLEVGKVNESTEGLPSYNSKNYVVTGDLDDNLKLNGKGVKTYKSGGSDAGNFKDNNLEGKGVRRTPNGDIITGTFKNGKPDGKAKLITSNNVVYAGTWDNGNISKEVVVKTPWSRSTYTLSKGNFDRDVYKLIEDDTEFLKNIYEELSGQGLVGYRNAKPTLSKDNIFYFKGKNTLENIPELSLKDLVSSYINYRDLFRGYLKEMGSVAGTSRKAIKKYNLGGRVGADNTEPAATQSIDPLDFFDVIPEENPVEIPPYLDPNTRGYEHANYRDLANKIIEGYETSDMIARKNGFESVYDVPYAYGAHLQPEKKLTEMTLGEVYNFGDAQIKATKGKLPNQPENIGTSALGRYQFTGATIRDMIESFGLPYDNDTLFTPEVQDNLFKHLLNKAGLDKYLEGEVDSSKLLKNLRDRWEGFKHLDDGQILASIDETFNTTQI